MPHRSQELFAAIDLGSNSFHMIVARQHEGQLTVIDRIREMVRLADGIDEEGNISPLVQERAVQCLKRFGERIADIPAWAVRIVGTNTLRNATNSEQFLVEAEQALNHSIDIIAGVEEARLIYLGVAHSLAVTDKRRFVMDIGGSSTELIIGDGYAPKYLESLEMGCVTMTQNFFADGVISIERINSGILHAKTELEPHAMRYKWLGWEQAIGASGSIRSVHKVLLAQNPAQTTVTLKALHELLNKTIELGAIANLAQLPGLNPERAPVFIGGLIVLTATFEALAIEEMEVSDRALREGLLHDLLGRHSDADIRDTSIENLARRYHADEEHSARIVNTARNLFHQAAPQLGLDEESEQWLIWAAQIHEIGLDIAHNRHHHHAAYVIEHSDLAGFSQQEQQLLAALVRSHRRKVPAKFFKDLPKRISKPTKRLAILLRLAVIMHRSRSKSTLPEIKLVVDGKNIQLTFPEGWLSEQALAQADLLQEQQYLSSIGFTLSLL